jgi:hypothetical protein
LGTFVQLFKAINAESSSKRNQLRGYDNAAWKNTDINLGCGWGNLFKLFRFQSDKPFKWALLL